MVRRGFAAGACCCGASEDAEPGQTFPMFDFGLAWVSEAAESLCQMKILTKRAAAWAAAAAAAAAATAAAAGGGAVLHSNDFTKRMQQSGSKNRNTNFKVFTASSI